MDEQEKALEMKFAIYNSTSRDHNIDNVELKRFALMFKKYHDKIKVDLNKTPKKNFKILNRNDFLNHLKDNHMVSKQERRDFIRASRFGQTF